MGQKQLHPIRSRRGRSCRSRRTDQNGTLTSTTDMLTTAGITSASLALGLFILYHTSGYAARRAFTKYTAVDDLSVLDKQRTRSKLNGTAVIAGGRYRVFLSILFRFPLTFSSLAGLFAALACAQNFEEVLIVEADEYANTEDSKAGTRRLPNGLQTHYSKRSRIMQQFALHGM